MNSSFLLNIAKSIVPWNHRSLIVALIKREIASRYKNSVVGLAWSLISPLFILIIYTVVFDKIFSVKWIGGNGSSIEFSILIFIGIMVFGFFSESITRAPLLIIGNPNYVKKIIFPLEVLPLVTIGVASFHMLASLSVFLIFYCIAIGLPPWTVIFYPVVLLPTFLLTLSFSWVISAIGVFFRDVNHIISALILPLMFMTPIFYPLSTLPPDLRKIIELSPLAQSIENARLVLYWGKVPSMALLITSTLMCGLFAILGFIFFQKSREGFADVL